MFKTILHNARASAAVVGVGLLTLTGCAGAPADTAAAVADVQKAITAPASPVAVAPVASAAPTPAPTPTPEIVVMEEWVESAVPFESIRQDDPNVDLGVETLLVAGAAGILATRFEVTLTDGVETGRVAVAEQLRVAPVAEVVGVGSRPPVLAVPPAPVQAVAAGNCDPNYEGDCVPIDSDVDCASGSGNGPSYVQGPVRVVGTDIYGLDRNGDGQGCE